MLQEPKFDTIKDYVNNTTAEPEDILYFLLEGLIEERTEIINLYLPKLISNIISVKTWTN